MAITARDLEKALSRKGFQKHEGKNHIQYFFYYKNKKMRIRVSISRGSNYVYSDKLLGYVRKEMELFNNQQLESFIQCVFTEEDYIKHLKLDESEDKDRENKNDRK